MAALPNVFNSVLNISSETGIDWDKVSATSNVYRIPNIWSDVPSKHNFNDETNRQAYIYMYASAHTWAVSLFLEEFCKLDNYGQFFPNHSLNICSIGGGPGTDVFGVKLFLHSIGLNVPITGTILEKYDAWEDTYKKLRDQLNLSGMNIKYETFDFLQEGVVQTTQEAIRQADLITLIKFVSTVAFNQDCRTKLEEILGQMKSNSVVLFIDNSAGQYREIMNYVGASLNMEKIYERTYFEASPIPQIEYNQIINYCQSVNKHWPLMTLKIAVSVWKKP